METPKPFGRKLYEDWKKEADQANARAEEFLAEVDQALQENGITEEEAVRRVKNFMAWQSTEPDILPIWEDSTYD